MKNMKLKIKVGTLKFEQTDNDHPEGVYSKGDIIEVTEERAKLFDKLDVQVIHEPVVPAKTVEPTPTVEPAPVKPVVKKTVKTVTATPPEPAKEEPPVIKEVKLAEEA